jgi:hypothetical protein
MVAVSGRSNGAAHLYSADFSMVGGPGIGTVPSIDCCCIVTETGENIMLGTIILIILILALVGALPTWGYSSGWGYGPSGGLGLLVVVLVILLLLGRI